MLLVFPILFSVYLTFYICPSKFFANYFYSPNLWELLIYDVFKSHMNVTDDLEIFAEDRIKFGKEESDTSASKKMYDKFQTNHYKAQKFSSWVWHGRRFM